jgi:hypothetical protein
MSDIPLSPASFEFLVFSLKMQAEMRMGLLGFGADKDEAPDLGAARHAIDMLAMISEKTRGNLSLEEQRLIENSLTELRFRYVQAVEDAAKAKAQSPAETPGEPESGATEASA